MGDKEPETNATVLELQQKLALAEEQLELIRTESEDAKRRESESADRVSELEQDLEDIGRKLDETERQYHAEIEKLQLKADLERLQQVEEVRRQVDKQRKYHRAERDRDQAQLKTELEAAKKSQRVRGRTETGAPRSVVPPVAELVSSWYE